MGISIIIILLGLIFCAVLFMINMQTKTDIDITEKGITLDDVLPIQSIQDEYLINGNGEITAGYRMFLPEIFTLSEKEAERIHNDISALLKLLPTGTIIQQQNYYYTDKYNNEKVKETENYIFRENLCSLNGKPILKSYTNIFITFKLKGKNKQSNSFQRKPNYPFKQPFRKVEERISEIENVLENFSNGMNNVSGISIQRMTDKELNNSLFDYLSAQPGKQCEDAEKCVAPPMSVSQDGEFKIGNRFVSVISLTEEGGIIYPSLKEGKVNSISDEIRIPLSIKSKCSMVYPVGLGLPFDHVLNVIIEVTDNDSTINKLKSQSRLLNPLVSFYEPASIRQSEIDTFCKDINQNSYLTAYTAVNVIISDEDKKELTRKSNLVKVAFSNMNESKCYIENEETANLFFASIPGNASANYRGFINTVIQGICYLQKESLYRSDPEGYLFLDRFGTPCLLEMRKSPEIVNKNRILIGPSGSGKSYWLNEFILQSVEIKNDVVIIDIGGSYKSNVLLNNGKYYDSRDKRHFSFNPFLCQRDKNGNYIYIYDDPDDPEAKNDVIQYITTVISVIWKPKGSGEQLRAVEKELLKESIIKFYNHVNKNKIFPCMDSYCFFMESYELDEMAKLKFDVTELLLMLKEYRKDGQNGFLLNSENNLDITSDRLIAFDLEDAKEADYFRVIIIIVLNLIADKIKKRKGITKELIIDEAFDFLNDEKMGDFIAYLFRTFRKKEGEILIAAQNVLFIKSCPPQIKDSILINSDTKILLNHSKFTDNYKDIQNVLSISESEIEMLDSLQEDERGREFYIKMGKKSGIFRLEVSPIADISYDSRQAKVVELQRLWDETGSIPAALNQMLENKEKEAKNG